MTSIIIPNWCPTTETEKNFKECLLAIHRSKNKTDYEIVVVDNGTQSIFYSEYEYDKLIKLYQNYGFAIACNVGSQVAMGEWLLFLNNDTAVHNDWLDEIMRVQKEFAADVVGAKLIYTNTNLIQHAGAHFGRSLKPFHLDHNLSSNFCKEDKIVPAVTGACMLVRAETFHELGGFDRIYINGCEDTDFCMKLHRSGGVCALAANTYIEHIECASPGRSLNNKRNWEIFNDRWKDYIKREIGSYKDSLLAEEI